MAQGKLSSFRGSSSGTSLAEYKRCELNRISLFLGSQFRVVLSDLCWLPVRHTVCFEICFK